jgi:PAS domain S-box-containing protein
LPVAPDRIRTGPGITRDFAERDSNVNTTGNQWLRPATINCVVLLAILHFTSLAGARELLSAENASGVPIQRQAIWSSSPVAVALACGLILAVSAAMVQAASMQRSGHQNRNGDHNGDNGRSRNGIHSQDPQTNAFNATQADHEEFCREIFEGAADLIFACDWDGRFNLINPSMRKLLGYGDDEIRELKVERIIAPEYRGVFKQTLDTKLATGKTAECELAFVSKDGKHRMFEVSARGVLKSCKPVGVHCIARDVTERKHAEVAAAEGSELLEVLLESSSDLIYFKDKESRFVRYSCGLLEHFQVDAADSLKGRTDFDFFTKDHAQPAYEDEQEVIRTGNSIIGKLEKETHKDGRTTWARTTKMPWRDKSGRIIGIVGITSDVTALKETEDTLARERELLRTLLENLPDAIYFKDLQSRYVHVSKSMALKTLRYAPSLMERRRELFRLERSESEASDTDLIVGLTDFDAFTEEHARPAYEDEQGIIRTGESILGKLEKETHPDGSVTWCLTSKIAWRDKAGNIIGTFGISRDITPLKEAQSELEATHKRLLTASRLAGMAEVATDVLHNVGNVLNSVNVSCSLVIDRVQECNFSNLAKIPQLLRDNAGRLDEFLTTDERGRHLPEYIDSLSQTFEDQKTFLLHELSQLRSHVEHIKQVISMQQNYSRVAGVEETVEVAQLVDDALHMNADALTRHSVTYEREFEPVPPVFVDKHRVLQILVNLIRNGKYALSDSERRVKQMKLRIVRSAWDRVQIQVIDNGIGIAPENLTRIFAHGFTTRKEGHGFGLHSGALAARELGGSLTVHSDGLGKGATFTLELPLNRNNSTA